MSDIFPIIESAPLNINNKSLPLYKEIKWDFEKNIPCFIDGDIVILEGIEAIKTWVFKAINTDRFKYLIYSWNYGNELKSLIGKEYTPSYSTAEGLRFIKECLEINEYINSVTILSGNFREGMIIDLTIKVDSVYGLEVIQYNVNNIL